MRTDSVKKYVIPNIPYLFILWACLKLGTAYRLAPGADFAHKLMGLGQSIGPAFADFAPGLHPLDWLIGIMGTSYATKEAVMTRIWNCVPYTLELAAISIFIAAVIGTPIGIISATKQYTAFDNVTMIFALIGISMPVFWIGILLILLFSVHLKWLPPSGWGTMKQMILPAITVAAQSVAVICRMTRSSMLEVIRQDYIRTVRAKGQKEYKIIISHALRNALIPIVTVIGLQFGALLGGAIMAETVFAIPGLGRLMIDAIKQRDYPIVQGVVLFVAVTFSLVNLLIDIIYAFIDPKIRAQYK